MSRCMLSCYYLQRGKVRSMMFLLVVLLVLLSCGRSSPSTPLHQQFNKNSFLTYGSLLKLHHPQTNRWLHSHEIKFGRGGMYSLTGYDREDLGNYWQILEQYPHSTKIYTEKVGCGHTVQLRSVIIGYSIRADDTTFGLTTELLPMVHGLDSQDSATNWVIKCQEGKEKGEPIRYGDLIRLKHAVTGKYILIDMAGMYTDFNCRGCEILRQIQVHAGDVRDVGEEAVGFKVVGGMSFTEIEHQEIVTSEQ